MSIDVQNILVWIFICVFISATGKFIDYLLNTELRKPEKYKLQIFFGNLFDKIDKVKFTEIQILMIEIILKIESLFIGKRYNLLKFIFLSMLVSQYFTFGSQYIAYRYEGHTSFWYSYYSLIPYWPFLGGTFISAPFPNLKSPLEILGLFWNNYLFDSITILITFYLLRIAYAKRRFAAVVFVDLVISYILSYLCVVLYFIVPPATQEIKFNILNFIPYLLNSYPVINGVTTSDSNMVFYSLTTFAPVAVYLVFLLFLSVSKPIHWVLTTIMWDFSKNQEETAFFKLATGFSVTAIVLKALYEILKNMT